MPLIEYSKIFIVTNAIVTIFKIKYLLLSCIIDDDDDDIMLFLLLIDNNDVVGVTSIIHANTKITIGILYHVSFRFCIYFNVDGNTRNSNIPLPKLIVA
jgi:hypothetical protein